VFSTLTEAELAGVGILLPDYVDLKGIGRRENIILKGELPNDTTLALSTALSTLNVFKNNNLYNLTVTAKNCRYAVHADSSGFIPNYEEHIENCYFEHLGNEAGLWNAIIAWGEGTSSGAKLYFKNCVFKGRQPYSTHNNINFSEGDYHEFENCEFISGLTTAVGFISLTSNNLCKVLFKGCQFKGAISETQDTGKTTMDYQIYGYGNSPTNHSVTNGQSIQKYLHFNDEIKVMKNHNSAVIARGKPVRMVDHYSVGTMWGSDTVKQMMGITAKESTTTSDVIVKTKGYFPVAWTTLTGIGTGTYIGVSGSNLVVVDTRDVAFAVAINANVFRILD